MSVVPIIVPVMSDSKTAAPAITDNRAEILRPRDAAQVAFAVTRAAREGRSLTVRSGGHGYWKPEPGGLTIDLRELDGIDVGEPSAQGRIVRIGAGALWGEVARALAPHGLGISSGDTASVGVAGLVVGGGIGVLVRDRGLAIDQLRAVQLVTADGRLLEVSEHEHGDLFWAIRGGGGNFGVVTRLDFEARELAGVVAGEFSTDGDQGEFLRAVRETLADAPHALTATYMDVPAMDPSAPAGARLGVVWAGTDQADAAVALAPLTALDGVRGSLAPQAYADVLLDMPHDPDDPGAPVLSVTGLYGQLDDALIDRLVAVRRAHPASAIFLRSLGGAFGEVAEEATAFPGRSATWFAMAIVFDLPGMLDDDTRTRVRTELAEIAEGRLAAYSNFTNPASITSTADFHTAPAWGRLRELKAQWDPQNLFTRNHNIAPGS
ncbi:FAD-binding oxidoreductase [Microbacterium panaciterrae]|uniref:FAD-binding oxidoreductase n=2 Tax=Microbacterium panaciterrae TaxID=985759 RepID=A0ABP8P1A0_9MICO